MAHAPSNMSGKQSNNIVNCNQLGAGVQLELTSALRKQLFKMENTAITIELIKIIGVT